jgi:hypothetical protein
LLVTALMPGKEALMTTVDYAPGAFDPVHDIDNFHTSWNQTECRPV